MHLSLIYTKPYFNLVISTARTTKIILGGRLSHRARFTYFNIVYINVHGPWLKYLQLCVTHRGALLQCCAGSTKEDFALLPSDRF